MAKRRRKRGAKQNSAQRAPEGTAHSDTGETRTADAATIAWTVSATTVLLCDLAAAAAYLAVRSRPTAKGAFVFAEVLIAAGSLVGLATLVLTPVVYRLRRVAPPTGLAVFAVCAALAPMLALAMRALR